MRRGKGRIVTTLCALTLIASVGHYALARPQVPDTTFTLLSGQRVSTSADLGGKVFLVNFWDTSCSTCIEEMPSMKALYERFHPAGLVFVSVAMRYTPRDYAVNYAQSRHLPFMLTIDDGRLAKAFGDVQLTPTTLVVNRRGKILKRYVGRLDFVELSNVVDQALKDPV
ncbi:TlpA family protein disulfide reductase [Burkholderia gladioli]|uniref:TlpA family protein disulfide reductase n=1 Tax=Burkholderia gladioli TaxID=28095 RepID=UPI00163FDC36|nr:TlpA disulfide reductase family protein [Burkholderia gladioli]MBJ9672952.1 TlpA family protein disulfide reductase [Burkholderia gladioli]MDN7459801.1 TlpA disulfide reductase family protein [Burkholderia gladioli]